MITTSNNPNIVNINIKNAIERMICRHGRREGRYDYPFLALSPLIVTRLSAKRVKFLNVSTSSNTLRKIDILKTIQEL
jgi:hypothetical protein